MRGFQKPADIDGDGNIDFIIKDFNASAAYHKDRVGSE